MEHCLQGCLARHTTTDSISRLMTYVGGFSCNLFHIIDVKFRLGTYPLNSAHKLHRRLNGPTGGHTRSLPRRAVTQQSIAC